MVVFWVCRVRDGDEGGGDGVDGVCSFCGGYGNGNQCHGFNITGDGDLDVIMIEEMKVYPVFVM